jgi:hypothetical protein
VVDPIGVSADLEFRHFFLGAGKTRIYFIAINFQRVATAGTTENFWQEGG